MQAKFRPQAPTQPRPMRWSVAWFGALLTSALVVGVSIAASIPDWAGTQPQNISNSEPNRARQPDVASGPGGQMAIAWSDQRLAGSPRNIYAVFSTDYGRTWSSPPEAVADTADHSLLPDLVLADNRVFVAWVDSSPPTAVYEAEKTETGTWERRHIPVSVPLTDMRPRLAVGAGRLHAVFNAGEGNQPDVLYSWRPLATPEWVTATVVHTHTATGSWYPVLTVGPHEETLHLVWEERASADVRAILYMSGTLNGTTVDWSPPLTLSTGITLSVWPDIAADAGGNLHVVWGEQIGAEALEQRQQYVRYARYDATSGSWSTREDPIDPQPVRVNELRPTDIAPVLTLREQGDRVEICVAWHGFREGEQVEPAEEVLLSCSQDEGQSWSAPQNVSRSPGKDEISIAPAITFDAWGRLHTVWEEHIGTSVVHDYEVYHAHGLDQVFLPLVMRS